MRCPVRLCVLLRFAAACLLLLPVSSPAASKRHRAEVSVTPTPTPDASPDFGALQQRSQQAVQELAARTPFAIPTVPVAPTPPNAQQAAATLLHSLNYHQGEIALPGGMAKLDVPGAFRFLDAADARKVLVDLWGNPPDAAEHVLGMITPASISPDQEESYGVIITYDEGGYVKDDDAEKINYSSLLTEMQQATREHNDARTKAGYPAMELVGWAMPPRYDRAAKKLYWAKELQVAGRDVHALNYDIRILGRRGVLILSAIAGMNQLDQINEAAPQILSMVNFQQGNRYADFDPKTDKVAAYGLAALVAGGILAKVGGFKLLLGVLLAAKKFVIIGVVAVIGFMKRIFGREPKVNNGPQALPPDNRGG